MRPPRTRSRSSTRPWPPTACRNGCCPTTGSRSTRRGADHRPARRARRRAGRRGDHRQAVQADHPGQERTLPPDPVPLPRQAAAGRHTGRAPGPGRRVRPHLQHRAPPPRAARADHAAGRLGGDPQGRSAPPEARPARLPPPAPARRPRPSRPQTYPPTPASERSSTAGTINSTRSSTRSTSTTPSSRSSSSATAPRPATRSSSPTSTARSSPSTPGPHPASATSATADPADHAPRTPDRHRSPDTPTVTDVLMQNCHRCPETSQPERWTWLDSSRTCVRRQVVRALRPHPQGHGGLAVAGQRLERSAVGAQDRRPRRRRTRLHVAGRPVAAAEVLPRPQLVTEGSRPPPAPASEGIDRPGRRAVRSHLTAGCPVQPGYLRAQSRRGVATVHRPGWIRRARHGPACSVLAQSFPAVGAADTAPSEILVLVKHGDDAPCSLPPRWHPNGSGQVPGSGVTADPSKIG